MSACYRVTEEWNVNTGIITFIFDLSVFAVNCDLYGGVSQIFACDLGDLCLEQV